MLRQVAKCRPADGTYRAKCRPADGTYRAKCRPADGTYRAKCRPADGTYRAKTQSYIDYSGRPMPILPFGEPIAELLPVA